MDESVDQRKFPIWRWLLIALALLLMGVFFAHAVWTGKARSRFEKQVAAFKAAGEPMRVEDFIESPLPDAQNIVLLIRKAADAHAQSEERSDREADLRENDPYAFMQPLTDAEASLLRETAQANANALQILRGADATTGAYWNDLPANMNIGSAYTSELGSFRAMANLLADDTRLAMHERRWADVVAGIDDLHAVAKSMYGRPGIIGSLVGTGMHSLAADVAQEAASTLIVDEQVGAKRADVQKLIRECLDDGFVVNNLRHGFRSERVMVCDAMLATIRPNSTTTVPTVRLNGFVRYAVTPLLYTNLSITLEIFDQSIKLADRPSQRAFNDVSGPLRALENQVRTSNVMLVAGVFAPSADRYVQTNFRLRTDRHLAAAALAIRLYAADNGGALPPSLDALVPTYLPSVPTDAMDGEPLRYDRTRAILWSVGPDLKDSGGDASMPRTLAVYNKWSAHDVVVHLAPFVRPKPAVDTPPADEGGATQSATQQQ